MSKRVAIVGAGVAGCAAAIQLAEQGFEVELFEAVAEPQPIGAGILLQPTGQQALQRMGLLDEALAHGACLHGLFGDTQSGREVLKMRYERYQPQSFGLGLQRGALMGLLWQRVRATPGIRWRCGVNVERYEQHEAEGVRLFSQDAEVGRADALILANGSFSHLREQMRVRQSARLFPWGAVWTVLPTPPGFPAVELRQRFRAARHMIGIMPVGRNFGEQGEGINLFWSLPTPQVQAWAHAGAAGLASLKREMVALFPMVEPLLPALQEASQLRQARYADVHMSSWHDGRVLAIGDCAHGMSPQLGQGVNMALVDAQVLAALARHDGGHDWPGRFAAFSAARRAHIRFYTLASRGLTPLFQSHGRLGPWLRDAFFGLGGRLPFVHHQSVLVLAGVKTGWLYGQLPL